MGLFKTPPRIFWEVPSIVQGTKAVGTVRLVCPAAVTIDRIVVELRCSISAVIRSAAIQTDETVRVVVLEERRELAAGPHEVAIAFDVPSSLPPTCFAGSFRVSWSASVQVSIPWWLDASKAFPITVTPMPVQTPEPRPVVARAQTPWPDFSVELDSDVIVAGGALRGRFVFHDEHIHHYTSAIIALRCDVEGQHWSMSESPDRLSESQVVTSRVVSLRRERSGAGVAFELPISFNVFPEIVLRRLEARWSVAFQVRASSIWRPELVVPLTVAPGRGVGTHAATMVSGGALRNPELRRQWAQVGLDHGYDNVNDVLLKRLHGGELAVTLRAGLLYHVVEAVLRMWPIDVGFRVEGGRLRCREPAQERALDLAIAPHAGAVKFIAAGDGHLRVAADMAFGSFPSLEGKLSSVESVCKAVLEVRAQLPVPDSVAHVVDVFADAAARLGGELVVAGMDIWGARDDMPFSLETRWDHDGALLCTALTVRPLLAIAARFHGHWGPDEFPAELPSGLAPLLEGALGLAIGPYAIELYLSPAPTSADDAVDRLEALIAVGHKLSMRGGLYR